MSTHVSLCCFFYLLNCFVRPLFFRVVCIFSSCWAFPRGCCYLCFSPLWLHLLSLNTSLNHVLNNFWHHSRATNVMSWNWQKVQQQFSEMISPPKSLLSRFPTTRQSKFHFNALIIICNLSGAARDKQDMTLDTDDTDRYTVIVFVRENYIWHQKVRKHVSFIITL